MRRRLVLQQIPAKHEKAHPWLLHRVVRLLPAVHHVQHDARWGVTHTPFDLIYTHMERAPQQFQLDNGCNLHSCALVREASFFADMRVLIDEPHHRGHSSCSINYNTGESAYVWCRRDGICGSLACDDKWLAYSYGLF